MIKERIIKLRYRYYFLWVACFLFLWLVFYIAAANFLDPDFGWQFRIGEFVSKNHSVPQRDIFSYTMPNYLLKYPAWLSELVIYRLYPLIGYKGLAFLGGFLTASAFMITLPPAMIGFGFIPLLLAGQACLAYMSVRPTMVSYLLASATFLILRKSYRKKTWLIVLPFLFLIWANLHGAFSIGLAAILFSILSDLYLVFRKKEKLLPHLWWTSLILLLSFFSVMINPYGWRAYQEVYQTLFSSELHRNIIEWLPYSDFNLGMFFYTSLFWALVFILRNKENFFEKLFALFLLVASLSSRRLLIYFFIFTLPEMGIMLRQTYYFMLKQTNFLKIWRHRNKILLGILVFISISYFPIIKLDSYLREDNFYPIKAIGYLESNPFEGNLFSTYNWGGYLIWKLPGKKVFIDGRMAIWKDNGYSAFNEQFEILSGEKEYQPVFEKYSIATVLLPTDPPVVKSLLVFLIDLIKPKESVLTFSQNLIKDGWLLVYQDGIAQVLINVSGEEELL